MHLEYTVDGDYRRNSNKRAQQVVHMLKLSNMNYHGHEHHNQRNHVISAVSRKTLIEP